MFLICTKVMYLYFRGQVITLYSIFDQKVPKKNGTVMWMASNCDTVNERMDYIRELQKYIQVDCFGPCLHNKESAWLDGKELKPSPRYISFLFVLMFQWKL